MRHWKRFVADESGTTAVEYALLLGIIILVSVTTLGGFGTGVENIYTIIDESLPTR
jgi:Flp pilus assembly pilin Flp